MKRELAIVLMLIMTAAVTGCQPQTGATADGYPAMFEGKPHLTTPVVYYRGSEIGRVVSAGSGFDGIVELTVAIDGAYRDLMTEDAVFYPMAGHLEYDRLSPAGGPIEEGSPVLGFSSRLSYNWHRFKSMLSSRRAAEKARSLHEKIRWAEITEIPI